MSDSGERQLGSLVAGVAALDASFIVAGVLGWSTVGVMDWRILAVAYCVRGALTLLYLWSLLGPVRRFLAAGAEADDPLLLEADEVLQRRLSRFHLSYPLGFVLALGLSFVLSLALPEFGTKVGRAEWVTVMVGASTCAVLSYAFILATMSWLVRGLIGEVSQALLLRGLKRRAMKRSLATELQWFLTMLVVGLLGVGMVIGGKARSDAIREREIVTQVMRAALAVADLRAGQELTKPGLRVVSSAELPSGLELEPDGRSAGGLDVQRGRALAAVSTGDQRWVLAEGEIEDDYGLFMALMAGVTLIMGAITYVSAIGLGRTLLQPLAELHAATRGMVEGGTLARVARAAPQHDDEVGELVEDFNAMLDMLEELVAAAGRVAEGDLRVAISQPGELHDAFRAMGAQLHNVVERLQVTTLDVANASAEIQARMFEQGRAATRLAQDVERASDNTQALAELADQVRETSTQVLDFALQSSMTTQTMAAKVTELDRQILGIGDRLEVIHEIAERSDLLALNGALEATRAGDAGRGFALVAAEMRRLAERVAATVEDVRAHLAQIRAASADAATITERGRSLAADTAQCAQRITTLTTTQSESALRASSATEAMAGFVADASAGVAEISATADGLLGRVQQLEELTGKFILSDDPQPASRALAQPGQ